MSKVLVTGGSGFIGSHLVDRLIELGHNVISVDTKAKLNPNAAGRLVNINDRSHTVDSYKDVDYVFHVAGQARVQPSIHDPQDSITNNVNATAKVLQLSKQAGVKRVIYSMTSSIYGSHQPPHTEDMCPQPLSPYAVSKLAGEQLCKVYSELYGLETASLRYFNVYGPGESEFGEYTTVVKKFLQQQAADQPLTIVGDGEQRRDFTHVYDIVEANIAAMNYQGELKGEIFNIGAGHNYSVNGVAKLISDSHQYLPARPGEARETLADNSKARKVLGWAPKLKLEDYIAESLS
jgi:UDP-glucose 4-epimerase